MPKTILITGANAGLGKESARQFALQDETQKIYLGVRNLEKGEAAKKELEAATGKRIFEILKIDVSNVDSVKEAVNSLPQPIEALVMNAGGMGGKTPLGKSQYGVLEIVAHNLIGHVALVDELILSNKLSGVVIYAGSEAARGVKKFGIKKPHFVSASTEEFETILNGSFFEANTDPMVVYAYVKHVAALWISSLARKNPGIRFVTVSPGGTGGTDVTKDANAMFKFMLGTSLGMAFSKLMGMAHDLEVGAKRYVDVVNDDGFKSGVFYASDNAKGAVGKLADQSKFFDNFKNEKYQDNANKALHKFIQ